MEGWRNFSSIVHRSAMNPPGTKSRFPKNIHVYRSQMTYYVGTSIEEPSRGQDTNNIRNAAAAKVAASFCLSLSLSVIIIFSRLALAAKWRCQHVEWSLCQYY